MSPTAVKLWNLLQQRAANYTLVEMKRELGVSKTGFLKAVAELEEAGLIIPEIEEV